jgi:hypothetical protein
MILDLTSLKKAITSLEAALLEHKKQNNDFLEITEAAVTQN